MESDTSLSPFMGHRRITSIKSVVGKYGGIAVIPQL
jgi:hypothetical protein